jgi:uncharacterized membrane protein YbaN (DUF454 family)
MHKWLTSIPHFGDAIIDWEKHRVIRRRAKVSASIVLVIVMGTSMIFAPITNTIRFIMAFIGVSVLIFIWTRKSHAHTKITD